MSERWDEDDGEESAEVKEDSERKVCAELDLGSPVPVGASESAAGAEEDAAPAGGDSRSEESAGAGEGVCPRLSLSGVGKRAKDEAESVWKNRLLGGEDGVTWGAVDVGEGSLLVRSLLPGAEASWRGERDALDVAVAAPPGEDDRVAAGRRDPLGEAPKLSVSRVKGERSRWWSKEG